MQHILDVRALDKLRQLGGDRLVSRMVGLFLENGPARLLSAREALAEGRAQDAERFFHSLGSSAANLGAYGLEGLSRRLERLAGEERLEEIPPLLPELEECLREAREALAEVAPPAEGA